MFRKAGFVIIIFGVILVAVFTYYRLSRLFSENQSAAGALCPNCNVIVVTLDTLGADRMGLYGYGRPTTPFLDSFALNRSIVFDHAIAQGSWTPLSHVSILAGRYPQEYGIYGARDKLPPSAKTIATALKERGYSTHAVSSALPITPRSGWGEGYDSYDVKWTLQSVNSNDAQEVFALSENWIKQNKKKPFFLFINTQHLHVPHAPATEDVMKQLGIEPPYYLDNARDMIEPNLRKGIITKEQLEVLSNHYDGLLRELDQETKKFIEQLDNMGIMQNTIVIFEGDHSFQYGQHGILGAYGVYHTQLHVPFIVYVPGQKPQRIASTVELRSIPATILDFLGSRKEPSFKGASLLPVIQGKQQKTIALSLNTLTLQSNLASMKTFYSTSDEDWEALKSGPAPTVRKAGDVPSNLWYSAINDNWQLIKNGEDDSLELYNLKRDPQENDNLIPQWFKLPDGEKKQVQELFESLGVKTP